jgi:predicted Fe-Mo cluster-binding NifX family protein
MKIAVAVQENHSVSQHFGCAEGYLVFETDGSKILSETPVFPGKDLGKHCRSGENPGHHHGHLDQLEGCECLISGGMGQGAAGRLLQAGIHPIVADQPQDSPRQLVEAYLRGDLRETQPHGCCGGRGHAEST